MLYSTWVDLPTPITCPLRYATGCFATLRENAIEVNYAAAEELGFIRLTVNGTYTLAGSVKSLNNSARTIDSVRMGMLEMSGTNGATGILSFDDFESRRFSGIGLMPEKGMDDPEAVQPQKIGGG